MSDNPKVYILAHVDYDTFGIQGVFSSREKAESVLRGSARGHENIEIFEYEVDANLGREFWAVHVVHFHPQYEAEPSDGFTRFDYLETPPPDESDVQDRGGPLATYRGMTVVSMEHAKQLAISASRQP